MWYLLFLDWACAIYANKTHDILCVCVYLRFSYKPEDSPVHGIVVHPQESFDNVSLKITQALNVSSAWSREVEYTCIDRCTRD